MVAAGLLNWHDSRKASSEPAAKPNLNFHLARSSYLKDHVGPILPTQHLALGSYLLRNGGRFRLRRVGIFVNVDH